MTVCYIKLHLIAFDYFGLVQIISERKTCGSRRVSEEDFPRCCTAVIPPVQVFAQGGRGGHDDGRGGGG